MHNNNKHNNITDPSPQLHASIAIYHMNHLEETYLTPITKDSQLAEEQQRRTIPTPYYWLSLLFFFCCHSLRLVTFYYNDRVTKFADDCFTLYKDVTDICKQTSGINFNFLNVPEAKYPPCLWHVNTVSSFMLCLNSSLNFFLYVLSGSRFRKTFCQKMTGFLSHCGLWSNTSSDESRTVRPGITQPPGTFCLGQ